MNSDEMIRCALRRLKFIDSHKYSGYLLWAAASDLFEIGSQSATALCRQHGLDPDELLPPSSMSKAVTVCEREYEDGNQSPAESCNKMLEGVQELAKRD